MTYNRDTFFHSLLDALDAPKNEENLDALRAWAACEGSNAEWNPLDTTQHAEGATPYNSFESGGATLHVWNYPDKETGVRATVETLRNGHYPHILAALKSGKGRAIVEGDARREMGTWGTSADCIGGKLRNEPRHDDEDAQKDDAQETTPTGIPHDVLSAMGRVTNYLRERQHRLTEDGHEHVQRLRKAAGHALGVK